MNLKNDAQGSEEMKENYEKAEMEIVEFETEDILTASLIEDGDED